MAIGLQSEGMATDDRVEDDCSLIINAQKKKETTSYGTSSLPPVMLADTTNFWKVRYTLGLMGFLGLALVYAMRVNLSVVIVAMVNNTDDVTVNVTHDSCPALKNTSAGPTAAPRTSGTFNWSEQTQGLILGSFFFGYVLTQVPGGRLSEKYGGKTIFGWGIFLTSLFTVLSPPAAYMGEGAFIFIRILEGLSEGVTFPSMCTIIARWVPPLERNTFAAAIYAGFNFGTVVSMPLSGYLTSVEFLDGWPLAFYVFGTMGLIWSLFWWLLVSDSPSTHRRISPEERDYIVYSIGEENLLDQKNTTFPLLSVLTCVPFWAVMVTQCGMAWAFYTQLTEMPTYMDHMLHFNLTDNALLISIPYLTSWISSLGFSWFADWLISRRYLSPVSSFKIFNTLASVVPSIGFIGVGLAGCDRQLAMILMSVLGTFVGAQYAGNQMNHIALSPRFAGTMYGMTNGVANVCGFLAPYIIGSINNEKETLEKWQFIFFLAAGINMATNLVYVLLGSAEEQAFNRVTESDITRDDDAMEKPPGAH